MDLGRQFGDLLVQTRVLRFHLPETGEEELVLLGDGLLLALQLLDLEAFPFPRGLGRGTVAQDTLDAPLFFLIFRLGPFSTEVSIPNSLRALSRLPILTLAEDSSLARVAPGPMTCVSSRVSSLLVWGLIPPRWAG